jgi:hypothetical protein
MKVSGLLWLQLLCCASLSSAREYSAKEGEGGIVVNHFYLDDMLFRLKGISGKVSDYYGP